MLQTQKGFKTCKTYIKEVILTLLNFENKVRMETICIKGPTLTIELTGERKYESRGKGEI